VLLGLASLHELPGDNSDNVIHALAARLLSPAMQVVFTLSLLAIIVSTATSALLAPSALLARNVLERTRWCQRHPLLTDRACVVGSAIASFALALSGDDALGFLEQALEIPLVALLVPFLGGFFGRPRGERPGLLAVVCGSVTWLAYSLAGWWWLPADLQPADASVPQALLMLPPALVGLAASAAGYAAGHCSSASPQAPPLVARP
jgi:Na+/proline symporter